MSTKIKGITLTGFLMFTLGLCILLVITFKFIPLYIEHYNVKQTLIMISAKKFSGENVPRQIRSAISKQFDIESIHNIQANDIVVERDSKGYHVFAEYDVIVPLSTHISVTLHFNTDVVVPQHV